MSLSITSLNSGSNGNCYYIGKGDCAVLVDAGISCRETEIRMKRLGLRMDTIKAVFISHEHKDHISGLTVLAKKYQLPVYITEATQANGKFHIEKKLVFRFKANEPVQIGELSVTAFSKFHDAGDPYSFIIASSAVKVGVFTDIGIACPQVIHHFQQCHAAFLEANYDEEMLANGSYPYYLKQRITNGMGHLSNTQALEVFKNHRPAFMSHLILSHLSKHNNDPELVKNLFSKHAGDTNIIVASRDKETELFHIGAGPAFKKEIARKKTTGQLQLSLF
jgi:phosphoribosyl 1,2-cyclic phosphodiesterase